MWRAASKQWSGVGEGGADRPLELPSSGGGIKLGALPHDFEIVALDRGLGIRHQHLGLEIQDAVGHLHDDLLFVPVAEPDIQLSELYVGFVQLLGILGDQIHGQFAVLIVLRDFDPLHRLADGDRKVDSLRGGRGSSRSCRKGPRGREQEGEKQVPDLGIRRAHGGWREAT
jgi:hypothetical protein